VFVNAISPDSSPSRGPETLPIFSRAATLSAVALVNAITHVLSPAMQAVVDRATLAAATDSNILILGEEGVGKRVLAHHIHSSSARAGKPLTELNVSGCSAELVGSELFGVASTASDPSQKPKAGLLESAGGATVVLHQIGYGEATIMNVVLETIKTRLAYRRWADTPTPIDVRFIATSLDNPDRESVDYTIGVKKCLPFFEVILKVPSLHERRSEIPELARSFAAEQAEGQPVSIQDDAMALLEGYWWLGNIRELRMVMSRAVVLCEGRAIGPEHLGLRATRSR
jgi:DNA-binding NtrC family response regulator